jgi:CRISPR/Cas system-associated exonuclease Cas4 (RecB family)
MRVGIGNKNRDIDTIFRMLNVDEGREIELDNFLIQTLIKRVASSDILFLILQKLERENYVKGSQGMIKVLKKIEDEKIRKLNRKINEGFKRNEKIFVTPLEVGKFYQCPRRFFLEKIVLARQFKERVGKVWDGEVMHFAINLFVRNWFKKKLEELVPYVVEVAMNKYRNRSTLSKEKLENFVQKFYEFIEEENFSHIFTEKTFESFKIGLVGTPDLVCFKNEKIVPIDIKLGRLSRRGMKEEHLLQVVGETILIEDFFRKNIDAGYMIYFGSNSLVKVDIDNKMKKNFINYKKRIEKICKSRQIPKKGSMPNLKRRVCLGCHVRPSCENIEALQETKF